jgi:hypothetical protein
MQAIGRPAGLREKGCGMAQGYLLGRPMAPYALERLFAETRPAAIAIEAESSPG